MLYRKYSEVSVYKGEASVYIITQISPVMSFTDVNFGIFTFVNMETAAEFFEHYSIIKVSEIRGRYFSRPQLESILKKFKDDFEIKEIGRSFLNLPIDSIRVGTGPVKILAWSQMHGNETTTTKGVFDLLQYFIINKRQKEIEQLLKKVTLLIIPMLNPDGAGRYTRENINKIDLNRDAMALKEPESKVLRHCFEDFQPHFCFNLHDQRTIFGAGERSNPATLSFLAPSMDADRSISPGREKAMKVIVAMNKLLQEVIPNQVGRFDDGFNLNCSGDYFQAQGVPTILFECGHFQEDYEREKTREFFTFSLLAAVRSIASGSYLEENHREYFEIPENKKNYYDVILRNALISGEKLDVAIQFSEKMKGGDVHFEPVVITMAPFLDFFGHKEIHCNGEVVENLQEEALSANDIVEAILLNKEKLLIKSAYIQ